MELTEIKKALYKEKPIAKLDNKITYNEKQYFHYISSCSIGDVYFKVPKEDMGIEEFKEEIPAQLLIRWIEN